VEIQSSPDSVIKIGAKDIGSHPEDEQEEASGQITDQEDLDPVVGTTACAMLKATNLSHISYVEQVCQRQGVLLDNIVSTKRQVKEMKKTLLCQ
jgi:hypothetical protein